MGLVGTSLKLKKSVLIFHLCVLGREDEYSRRRDSKPDSTGSRDFKFTSSSRSRFDKFHESPRSKDHCSIKVVAREEELRYEIWF